MSALPRRLVRAFGPGEHYTFLQAKRAIADLRLSKALVPYALAAACLLEELEKANVPISAHEYERLRTELADLFHLRGTEFSVSHLLATPYSSHHPAQENVYASSGPPASQ